MPPLPPNNLLVRTIANKQLPNKEEIFIAAKNLAQDFLKNPVKVTREGLARDKAANELAQMAGYSRGQIVGNGVYALREPIKDLAVNTGGFVGSHLTPDLPSQLALDWGGAYLTRRTIDDSFALTNAIKTAHSSPQWATQNLLERGQSIYNNAATDIYTNLPTTKAAVFNDTVGWGIGNGTAQTVPISMPFKGAVTAMTYGPEVGIGIKRVIAGEPLKTVASETWEQVAKKVPQSWEKGWGRESQMYDDVNNALQRLPDNALDLLNSYLS